MPSVSRRARKLPSSAIRKFMPLARKMRAKGVHVYHLNIGQPDIRTPGPFLDAVREFSGPVVEYEHSEGNFSLRKAVSDYYKKFRIPMSPDEIIITTGGSEALIIAMGIVCEAGDEIIVPEPYYTNYNTFATASDAVIVPITTRLEDNFELKSMHRLESMITPRSKAILINSPCNPTGAVLTQDELRMIASVAKKHGLFVISDEVYREFAYDGKVAASIIGMKGMGENTIIIDSISKRYSSCGAKIHRRGQERV